MIEQITRRHVLRLGAAGGLAAGCRYVLGAEKPESGEGKDLSPVPLVLLCVVGAFHLIGVNGTAGISVAAESPQVIELSQQHHDAVNRPRRIVVHADAKGNIGKDEYRDIDRWVGHHFGYLDEPGVQVDSIWWDCGIGRWATYPSKVLEPLAAMQPWWDQGIDWVEVLVRECRKRNLEVFWSHRVNEGDFRPEWPKGDGSTDRYLPKSVHPLKKAHPERVVKCWWWQGNWNYAVPEVRQYQLSILRELAEDYDFDGIQLDFSRSIPHLPIGRQWELRDHLTEFVRMVRLMTLEIEHKRGKPFLLAAKVPRNLEGCRADGFDVERWAEDNLIDILTLGNRSMDVDVAAFRQITTGKNIKLQPTLDNWHVTDGYTVPPIEFFRGVFADWWRQGADSVVTMNFTNAVLTEDSAPRHRVEQQAYHEIGSPQTLAFKDKFFAVERRGGVPRADGYFVRNDIAPLPMPLPYYGNPVDFTVRISDELKESTDKVDQVTLRLVLFGAKSGDGFDVKLNDVVLRPAVRDRDWKDPQVFGPGDQPASSGGSVARYPVGRSPKLLRLDYGVVPEQCLLGANTVAVRLAKRDPRNYPEIVIVEKLELHVSYRKAEDSP